MLRRMILFSAIGLVSIVSQTAPAFPFGALAVGATDDVARDGIAIGRANNYPTQAEADRAALEKCKAFRAQKAAAQCRLVGGLSDGQCLAISLDPEDGTPGAGWAIASDKSAAESRAVANCRKAAGAGRQQYCVVSLSRCEGERASDDKN